MRRLLLVSAVLLIVQAQNAYADPCDAIPENGSIPANLKFGATFSGPVVHVIDGDSLCVATGPGHDQWVEVRLADFYAAESNQPAGRAAKAALEKLAMGREAICVANLGTHDRIAARCSVEGHLLGDMMRDAGISEGGNASARSSAPVRARLGPAARPPVGPGAFRTCAQAWAVGAAPVRQGQPGYNPNLDGDHDGIACEPIRGRSISRPHVPMRARR